MKCVTNHSPRSSGVAEHCIDAVSMGLMTPDRRPLFRGLNLRMGREKVAVIGRNGVGKSSLLHVIAGIESPQKGHICIRGDALLIPQMLDGFSGDSPVDTSSILDAHPEDVLTSEARKAELSLKQLTHPDGLSSGERRKRLLLLAKLSGPSLLLLDEPTHDLDESGIRWLTDWLTAFDGGVLMISHERALLRLFQHFFIVRESGCRYFSGSFDALLDTLDEENAKEQRRYIRGLNRLLERESHHAAVCRRRRRKKNVGRLREEARMPTKAQLKSNKGYAQMSQGRAAKIRNNRITGARFCAKTGRTRLRVELPLRLHVPKAVHPGESDIVRLIDVGMTIAGKRLFHGLNVTIRTDRIGVTGANGSGKTTLVKTMQKEIAPDTGRVIADVARMGVIHQGASNWCIDDSLLSRLSLLSGETSPDKLMSIILSHKFPPALATRPMKTLSPGERTRAAFIGLFQRVPVYDLLILDEPTFGLDFVGYGALAAALLRWPNGLVVVSHDREFLDLAGIDQEIRLCSPCSPHSG